MHRLATWSTLAVLLLVGAGVGAEEEQVIEDEPLVATSAHQLLSQMENFVRMRGRNVTWRSTELVELPDYLKLLLPSASIDCGAPCRAKEMDNLIHPVSAVVMRNSNNQLGMMFFVEAHKLVLNGKHPVRVELLGCGVGPAETATENRLWTKAMSTRFETLRNHRWYEVTARTRPLSSAFAKVWCPLPQLAASGLEAVRPANNELYSNIVWDTATGRWQTLRNTPPLARSSAVAPMNKPWLRVRAGPCEATCQLSTFEPLVLPRKTKLAEHGVVVGIMHHVTPILEQFMRYYRDHFDVTHFTFYTNESWVNASENGLHPPPGVSATVIQWPSPLQTYKFGKSLALADFTDRARYAYEWVYSIDVDEFLIYNPPTPGLRFPDLLRQKRQEDPAIACYTLLRHNVKRDCSLPQVRYARGHNVTLQDMISDKDRNYVSPKAVYHLPATQQVRVPPQGPCCTRVFCKQLNDYATPIPM
ncbi:uncharacterized protein MONBRDRAFT_24301 [Monosiga brevicollis MX1]|uniref:Glycosyltransferase family 92 protein n=1 Tax=Monosiga brevicollis TaxID=81824 RepID=A9UW03_MONBE|nr:uncharacterized protein MONBRDRAFT_24301 [Monosiga brevicollis MX1]EDQ90682.1 predicted protein [Monosiga brevicollis MX1]|eukprot:XP_001744733.1 hypothetical protein [Monosiga brevicollis MX1]